MYCEFFGLTTQPFNNTPDPRFFFNTPDHEEALASLHYAVQQRKGFVLVTGEVGSGKTLLSRLLLNRLGSNVRTAVITNTRLTASELLTAICREFELDVEGCSTAAELSRTLEEFLLEQYARDRLAVVILDEAQNLPLEALEELRMLGNLEADDAKLLQVLILGQPELQDSFRRPSMRQTFQRIFRTFHLKALDRELTAGYIAHRFTVAGLPSEKPIFNADAIDAICEHSEGIPRLINQLCDNALLAAYSDSRRTIGGELINEVVEQMMSLNAPTSGVDADGREPGRPHRKSTGHEDRLHELATRLETFERDLGIVKRQGLNLQGKQQSEARDLDHHGGQLQRIADRMGTLEKALQDVRQQAQSLARENRAEEIDVNAVKQTQQSASKLLRGVTVKAQQSERHMQEILDETRQTARSVEGRATAEIGEVRQETERLRAAAQSTLKEVAAFSQDQGTNVSEIVSRGNAEIEAVHRIRKDASDLCEKVAATQRQSEAHLQSAIKSASEVSDALRNQAATFLGESRAETGNIQDELRRLLDEIRVKGDATQARAAELLSQQRTDIESSRRLLDELAAGVHERNERIDRESEAMLDELKSQAKTINEETRAIREQSRAQAQQAGAAMEAFTRDMREKIETSHRKLSGLVVSSECDVKTLCASLNSTKEQILAEAEDSRWHANEVLEKTQELLTSTREECGSLLCNLRDQISSQTEKARQIWQTSAARGAETLSELNAKLDKARQQSDASRAELDALVQDAAGEISKAKDSLTESLTGHRTDLARLSKDATALKAGFQQRFEDAKAALDEAIQIHRGDADARLSEIAADTEQGITQTRAYVDDRIEKLNTDMEAEVQAHVSSSKTSVSHTITEAEEHIREAESQAGHRVAQLKAELAMTSQAAEQICLELRNSIEVIQDNAVECQDQFERESQKTQREMTGVVERGRAHLEETRSDVKGLSEQAGKTAASMESQLDTLHETARSRVAQIGREFEQALSRTMSRTESIRKESETAAEGLASRMRETRENATKAIDGAEQAAGMIRRHGESSLAEVRSCLTQMTEQSEVLRADLVRMGDEIQEAARGGGEQLQKTGQRVVSQIETMRESARRDADANHQRLSTLRQQVENSAEQMRQNACKLLDQVQAGAVGLRQHADELLSQAQSGSERLNTSAANMLMQAQTAAEQFREQAENLLRRTESTAAEVRDEVQELRSEVSTDADQLRQQIVSVKHEMAETRRDSVRIAADAVETQKNAQTKAELLLKRAETVQEQSEALLSLPKELIDEAKRQAEGLGKMSKRISTIVRQLSTSSDAAERHKQALAEAGDAADDRVDNLKRHAERVGQLVGIIRQLYGTMDARINRLRGRLTQMDDLFSIVPQEIDNLRAVFDHDDRLDSVGADLGVSAPAPRRTDQRRRRNSPVIKAAASAPSPGIGRAEDPAKPAVRQDWPPTIHGAPGAQGSLGEIVQRNQKLNQWLKDMLGEEALPNKITQTAPDRTQANEPAKT